jgi:hypothetical protein
MTRSPSRTLAAPLRRGAAAAHRSRRWAIVLAASLAAAAPSLAAQPSTPAADAGTRPVVRAAAVHGAPPVIDGRLDEDVWASAPVATDFVQREPQEGAPATQRTEVRVLYDASAIYVGARMFDTHPDSIVGALSRRDNGIYSDWFHLGFDSYHDRRTAFVFGVNARGVQQDILVSDDTRFDGTWDAVWSSAVAIDSLGWTAELRIPLSQLRFTGGVGERTWGLQYRRWLARRNEFSFWAPLPRNAPGDVSFYGTLEGLRDLPAPRRLEILPYTVARFTRAPGEPANALHQANRLAGSAGMDVKYGLTSNLTLTASLNPDFGQVEADPSEVNLTAFETRFSERRPLFLEGADIFHVPVGEDWWGGERVFYSRRIGRPPQRRAGAPDGFVDAPEATTLLGAVKLSGKTAGGWSIGALDVVTAREQATTVDAEGRVGREPVEPLTNHAVVRVKKDFRSGGSGLGAVFTAANRRLGSGDELAFLRSAAYVGGLDARHRFGGGDYVANATVLASRVQGSAAAIDRTQRSSVRYFQRPDATHVTYDPGRTTLSGMAAAATVRKNGGNWRGALDAMVRSPGFEINDLGFQRLADRISEASYVGYQQFRPGSVFRRWRVDVFQYAQWNFGGERVENSVGTDNNFQLLNYWGGYFGVERLFPGLSTDLLRGGPAVRTPARVNLWTGLNSDSRKPLSGRIDLNVAREEETGGAFLRVEPGATYRPSARLEFSLSPATAWNTVPWQFVATRAAGGETHHVVGRLEQRTVSLTGRLNYTFLPNLSLQTYVQPFISTGTYAAFQELRQPRASRLGDRFAPFAADALEYDGQAALYRVDRDGDGTADYVFGNPDFNVRELRSNTVLRWEYRPGSALFVVWSQGRSDTDLAGPFRFGRDAERLLSAAPTNVLLVKFSYWLDR